MSSNTLDLRRHMRELKKSKWLIIASLLVFSLFAVYYCLHHMPLYTIKSVMLIEEEQDNGSGTAISKAGGLSQMMRAFSIGGFGASSVDNERIIAETHQVLVQTIKDLELNCTYIGHDGIKREVLYGGTSPIKVEAASELYDTLSVGLKMDIKLDGDKANIKVKKGAFKTLVTLDDASLPCEVKTPYGYFKILKCTPTSRINSAPDDISVIIAGNDALAEYLRKKIELGLYDKKADAVEFTYEDPCPERGIDIVNTLMSNYNKVRKNHKDEVSLKEIEFYDNRITTLIQELNDADSRMVEFKQHNNIVDIETQAGAMIKANAESQQEAVKLQAEMEINKMILNSLNKGGNNVLPALGDESMAAVITQYNELVMSRQELERSAKPGNEALTALNKTIAESRKTITEAAQKGIEASRIKLSQLNQVANQDNAKMSRVPSQERDYLNLLRDKELKNELFIFLMQRRESSKLQLTKNTSPSFIIDKAYKSVKPSYLKPIIVTLALLLIGVILPILWILFMMKKRNLIVNKYDLDDKLEEQAWEVLTLKGKGINFNEVRSKLFEMNGINTIYTHDVTHSNYAILQGFISSLEKANKTIARHKVDNIDKLYSPNFCADVEKSKNNDYVFIEIDNIDTLSEINDKLSMPNTGLLLLIEKNKCKRDDFNKLMSGTNEDYYKRTLIIIA